MGTRVEQWADGIELWAEDFEDSMESLADYMEELGDDLEEMAENSNGDSTLTVYGNGGVVTYYKWHDNGNGKRIRLSNKDRYLTRKFDIGAFKGVEISHSFQVVMCDTVDKVVVLINEKLDKQLNVRLNKGVLVVKLDNVNNVICDNAKFGYIYLPYNTKLSSVSLSGTSTFYTDLPIKVSTFEIDLSGATACTLKRGVACNNLEVDLSGTSVCKGRFACKNSSIDMSGATYFGGILKGTNTELDLEGISNLKAKISTTFLEADLSGASVITLEGNATNMEISLSGTSKFDGGSLTTTNIAGELSGASSAHVNSNGTIAVDLSGTSELIYEGQADVSRSSASRMASIRRK